MLDSFVTYIEYERHYSPHTVLAYKNDLLQFLDFVQCTPEQFTPSTVTDTDVRNWMLSLLKENESPRSVRRKLSSLKSFWRFAQKTGAIQKNVLTKLVMPKVKKSIPTFYKPSEMSAALDQETPQNDFEAVRNTLIIQLLYETGIRRAELIGLQLADVNLTECTLKVLGKRNKERIIPFGLNLKQSIQHYIELRATVAFHEQNLFLRKNGKSLYPKMVYTVVHNQMSAVSTLQKQSPHVLRHTFATAMLNNGADINAVKSLLGHASLAATQVYTHTTFDQIQRIYKQAHPRALKKGGHYEH